MPWLRAFFAAVFAWLLGACSATAVSTTAAPAPADWPSYNRDLLGHRYSPLTQITSANASSLKRVCRTRLNESGPLQAGLLAIGGTIYVTTAQDTYAIDGANCQLRWENDYASAGPEPDLVDRGVAWDGGTRLIRGEPDGHLIAIDMKSGDTLWDVAPANGALGEFLSSAPIAWNGTVYIGTAGSDWGIKGRMMAFDVRNGEQKWSFSTIASGNESSGGGMWTSYALDPATDELFISVGNPAPDLAPADRPGSTLYTNSEVALDAATGTLEWYFQADGDDGHDWDLAAPADLVRVGSASLAAVASKDGYLYVLDRAVHALRWKAAFVRIVNAKQAPTVAGERTCPGALGGAEWNGAAFDALHQQFITPMDDWCATFKLHRTRHVPGQFFFDGRAIGGTIANARGTLTASDALTGHTNWQYHSESPMIAGVTPTAGGITITGDMAGNLLIFDSRSGKLLFKDRTRGAIAGGVITYDAGGKQYVAATSGNVSRFGWGMNGEPAIVIYAR